MKISPFGRDDKQGYYFKINRLVIIKPLSVSVVRYRDDGSAVRIIREPCCLREPDQGRKEPIFPKGRAIWRTFRRMVATPLVMR